MCHSNSAAAPEHETLHDKVELLLVAVGEAGSFPTHADVEGVAGLELSRLEVVAHVGNDPIHGVPVEQQERVVVGDAVQAVQDFLLLQIPIAVPAHTSL